MALHAHQFVFGLVGNSIWPYLHYIASLIENGKGKDVTQEVIDALNNKN